MKRQEDLRILKSKRLIKDTFLQLIQIKGYQHITITDIANTAQINRKTFYFHYESIEVLYEEMTDEYLSLVDFSTLLPTLQIELANSDFFIMAVSILERIKKQKDPIKILLEDSTNQRFNDKLRRFLTTVMLNTIKLEDYAASKVFPIVLVQSIYSNIFLEIIKWWISQEEVSSKRAIEIMLSMFSDSMITAMGIDLIP